MVAELLLADVALAAGAWLATYLIHSTVLLAGALGAGALIERLARRSARIADAAPALRENLGRVALLAGIATASVQHAAGIAPFGLRAALPWEAAPRTAEFERAFPPSSTTQPAAVPARAARTREPSVPERALAPGVPLVLLPAVWLAQSSTPDVGFRADGGGAIAAEAAPGPAVLAAPLTAPAWLWAVLGLWAAGAVCGALGWLRGYAALRRSLSASRAVPAGSARELFDELCARAGVRGVELTESPDLAAPITRGILRREVCVPPRALTELGAEELSALLAHEIAHAARRDPTWLSVCRAIEILLPLQPLNRRLARELEDDAELLCDDRAVVMTGDRLPLASCLTEVASWIVAPHRGPLLAVGMAAHGTRLARRVERLIDDEHEPDAGGSRPMPGIAAAAVAAGVALLAPGFAAPDLPRDRAEAIALEIAAATSDEESERARLELLLADAADPIEPPCSEPPPAPEDPTERWLQALELEIATLRADLDEREGGAELRARLDALTDHVRSLRQRALDLECALAAGTDALLSPTQPRPAEVLFR